MATFFGVAKSPADRGSKNELPVGLQALLWGPPRMGAIYDDGQRLIVAVAVKDRGRKVGYRYEIAIVVVSDGSLLIETTGDVFGWEYEDIDWLAYVE